MQLAYLLSRTALGAAFQKLLFPSIRSLHHANGLLSVGSTPSRFFPSTSSAHTSLVTRLIHSPESHQREGRKRAAITSQTPEKIGRQRLVAKLAIPLRNEILVLRWILRFTDGVSRTAKVGRGGRRKNLRL